MSPFSIFALFYMTAFFLEMVEKWKFPGFTLVSFLLIPIFIFTKITRTKFLVFLVLTTAYFLLFHFPEVANHVNLFIFCNIVMIGGLIYSFAHPSNYVMDDYFEIIRPVLRATLILVYVLSGFHKLNRDFLNPEVSCSRGMLEALLPIIKSRVFGIPITPVLAFGVLIVLWQLVGSCRILAKFRILTLLLISGAGLMLCGGLLILKLYIGIPTAFKLLVVVATGILVILWELIGGLLLIVPKFQAPVLLFSWAMHSVLAVIGFVDFGGLAFALLLTFIPSSYYQVLNRHATLHFSELRIHRAYVYFLINAIGGILSGIHYRVHPFLDIQVVAGMLFNLASIIFIWPILSIVFLPSHRPIWGGIPIFNQKMPKFMFVFLAFLMFYGMTSYLGLRTTGNFSMFSNLRTEGEFSNHLLLSSNPLKIWNYQEDVVQVIKIDDKRAEIGHQYQPLQGNELPIVEFRKLIHKWTMAGHTVPVIFRYQGKTYSTKDISNDPVWHADGRNWEMVLMDFRVIQPISDGPNGCYW